MMIGQLDMIKEIDNCESSTVINITLIIYSDLKSLQNYEIPNKEPC